MGDYMRSSRWAWPVLESLHSWACRSLSARGVFDLRLLGFARGIPYAALHRLIPWASRGHPQRLDGALFHLGHTGPVPLQPGLHREGRVHDHRGPQRRVLLREGVQAAAAHGSPGVASARRAAAGGVSLAAWVGVMSAGRLLTFFRP